MPFRFTLAVLGCVLACSAQARLGALPPEAPRHVVARDLAAIERAGELRVLVNQSRHSSGEWNGQALGVEYRRLQAFAHYLQHQPGGRHLRLVFVPKAKEDLLPALQRGEGDLVAPGETLLPPAHSALIAAAVAAPANLVVVGGRGQRLPRHLEQLAGRRVVLPQGSAAGPALARLNAQLERRKLRPVQIEWADPTLAVEDVLELTQAGIYPLTVVESGLAHRWARVLPRLQVADRVVVAHDQAQLWYLRAPAQQLAQRVRAFARQPQARDDDKAFRQASARRYQVRNPLLGNERRRLAKIRPLLQRYAKAYGFDWLTLAAMAYKESGLDPHARGAGRAAGLLQITPRAARSVGVRDIHSAEGNVKAATRYLARLRREFFSSPRLSERERRAFTLAAYNLGPERVQALRAKARNQGLDGDRWFFQVERVAAEEVGIGVVNYVDSVNKYRVAFSLERTRLEAPTVAATTTTARRGDDG
ncbi:transglycosylase SLT domain-containing protein [Pseudomonas oryzihabitans]|uniref:transglycosylase SLT domain-containing protein n=1 Tax=Pseudomonas oryzihabitans TaxID=47885 RepID=UPI002859C091|nr:transglycosylase SLT domain-containing protein [Pseudomonas psychrotolerans]MDR6679437.1 membrane-bound lytic murein transglycosylase MltF [Pseudomonas psychrotolerans]